MLLTRRLLLCSIIPASLFIGFLGTVSAYSFYLVGRMCHQDGAKSLGELWDKAIGKESSWLITLSVFTFAMGAALAYSIVLGDAFSSLTETIGLKVHPSNSTLLY
jgi:amino acid permease